MRLTKTYIIDNTEVTESIEINTSSWSLQDTKDFLHFMSNSIFEWNSIDITLEGGQKKNA